MDKKPIGLSEWIEEGIKDYIISNKLNSGDLLPTESEFAEMFSVGRSSIREAIKRLEVTGIVYVQHGKGTYVEDTNLNILKSQLSFYLQNGNVDLEDLIETRLIIEEACVDIACKRADSDDIREMERILNIMRNETDMLKVVNQGIEFHFAISKSTKNPLLICLISAIREVWYEIFTELDRSPEQIKKSVEEHELILNNIKNRNLTGAKHSMKLHLLSLENAAIQNETNK